MDLVKALEHYVPYNEQEEKDRQVMLQLLRTTPDIFERKNQTAHFTASSWLLNREHDKVLMIYHNIYHSWAWTGGHADGETGSSCRCHERGKRGDRRDSNQSVVRASVFH